MKLVKDTEVLWDQMLHAVAIENNKNIFVEIPEPIDIAQEDTLTLVVSDTEQYTFKVDNFTYSIKPHKRFIIRGTLQ